MDVNVYRVTKTYFWEHPLFWTKAQMPCNSEQLSLFPWDIYTHLRLYISYYEHNARILNYRTVAYLYIDKVHKAEVQKHAEIPSNHSLYKSSYLSEKNILITRSISKFISVIYFSIKITNKE